RGDQLPARRVVLADPRFVIAEMVEPLDQLHVPAEGERGILPYPVKRSQEDAELHSAMGHDPSPGAIHNGAGSSAATHLKVLQSAAFQQPATAPRYCSRSHVDTKGDRPWSSTSSCCPTRRPHRRRPPTATPSAPATSGSSPASWGSIRRPTRSCRA